MARAISLLIALATALTAVSGRPSPAADARLAIPAVGSAGRHDDCHRVHVRRRTFKTLKEKPFAALFHDMKNHSKFEASGIYRKDTKDGTEYVAVFDNSYALGYLQDEHFDFRASWLLGEMGDGDSQLEGVAYQYESDTWLLLHEAFPTEGTYKPFVTHVKLRKDRSGYDVQKQCEVNFELSHENKGLEEIAYLQAGNGSYYMLGLCEGNHCSGGDKGKEPGNGRIVFAQLQDAAQVDGGNECVWEPTAVIDIPPTAYFEDYAGFAFNKELGKVAIVSQVDAAVWVGPFDFETLTFPDPEGGQVFHFPRDNKCNIRYCNVEGIAWIDEYRIIVVSDKAKRYQDYHCDAKDQSVHIMQMPATWKPWGRTSGAAQQDEDAAEL